jgi:hypothetical protein
VDDARRDWPGRLLNQLQGASSLGMALSSGAVGFSASMLDPAAYAGFWMSTVFQMHAGFQFLSVGFGLAFAIARLKILDIASQISRSAHDETAGGHLDQLRNQTCRLGQFSRTTIYGQMVLLAAGGASFVCLLLMHFRRALYP